MRAVDGPTFRELMDAFAARSAAGEDELDRRGGRRAISPRPRRKGPSDGLLLPVLFPIAVFAAALAVVCALVSG